MGDITRSVKIKLHLKKNLLLKKVLNFFTES